MAAAESVDVIPRSFGSLGFQPATTAYSIHYKPTN